VGEQGGSAGVPGSIAKGRTIKTGEHFKHGVFPVLLAVKKVFYTTFLKFTGSACACRTGGASCKESLTPQGFPPPPHMSLAAVGSFRGEKPKRRQWRMKRGESPVSKQVLRF
jgi:hypothetical protein